MAEWKPDERFFGFLRTRINDKDQILKRLVIVLASVKEGSFDLEGIIGEMVAGSATGRVIYERLYCINPVVMDMYKDYLSQSSTS